jgi:hypothetical protein
MAADVDEADDVSVTGEENGSLPLLEGGKPASLPLPVASTAADTSYQSLKRLDRIPARVKYNVAHYFFMNDVGNTNNSNSSSKKEKMETAEEGEDHGDTTSVSSVSLSYRPPVDVDINDRKAIIKHFLSYLSRVYEVRGVLNYKDADPDGNEDDQGIADPNGRKDKRKGYFDMEIVGELVKITTCKAKIREIYELLKDEEVNQRKEEFNKALTYQSSMMIYDWRMIIDFNDYNNINNRPFLSFYKEQLKPGGYLHTLLREASASSGTSSSSGSISAAVTGYGSGCGISHLLEEKYLPKLSFCSSLVKSNYEKSHFLLEVNGGNGLLSENKNEVIIHYELPKSIETSLFRNVKVIMEEKLGFSKEISFNAMVLLSRYLLSSPSDTSIVKESVIILSAIILLTFKNYHALTPLSASPSSASSSSSAGVSSLIPSLSSVFSSSSSIKPSFLKKIVKFVYCQLNYRDPLKEDNSSIIHLLPKVLEKEYEIYSKALCYDCYIPAVFSFLSSSFLIHHQQIISEEGENSLAFLISEALSLSQFAYSSYFGLVNAFSLELLMMSCLMLCYYYLKAETKEERREERRMEENRRKEEEERNRRRNGGAMAKKDTTSSASSSNTTLPLMNDDILPLTLLQQVMSYFEISSSSLITAMKYLVELLELTKKSTSFSSATSSSGAATNNSASSGINNLPVLLEDYFIKRSKDSSSSSSLHSLLEIALKELLTIRNENALNSNKGDLSTTVTALKGEFFFLFSLPSF